MHMRNRPKRKVIPLRTFIRRFILCFVLAAIIVIAALSLGIFGYHYIAKLDWIDALLNASMILTGMGPVAILTTNEAKYFASFYALFSGVIFLTAVSIALVPIYHRFMHHFHLADEDINGISPDNDESELSTSISRR